MTSAAMNYSVFKLQNQGGKPGIFWEKDCFGFPTVPSFLPTIETVPKNDRKFGYKNKVQRFPVRRFAEDRHHVDTGLVSLTPDEPAPPPKPAKNFIQRNKKKVTAKGKPEPAKTVTLTQEQLNAILRSVGKVTGGSENAIKISIADKDHITIESPVRNDHDDSDTEVHNHRDGGRRSKKKEPADGNSIYSLLDSKSKQKSPSDNESYQSDDSLRIEKKSKSRHHRRKQRSRREEEEDEDDNRYEKSRRQKNRKNEDEVDDEIENIRRRNRRNRSKPRYDDDDDYDDRDDAKDRRRRARTRHSDEEDDEDYNRRRHRNRSKQRNDSDNEAEDIETQARERKEKQKSERTRKYKSDSVERREVRDKVDTLNVSGNEDKFEEIPSPRDKIGLPMDLSWRHMTKAERRRLETARQKVVDEEDKKEEDRIRSLNDKYGSPEREERKPQRHKLLPPPRSDPVTRLDKYDRGRDTEATDYSDARERRGRRSRSPEVRSRTPERSPDPQSHTSPIGLPRRHMTLAEKKKLEWEKDRAESVLLQGNNNDPWGRPGAGAPIRTRSGHVVADYKNRQDHMHNPGTIREEPAQESTNEPPVVDQTERKYKRSRSPPVEPAVNQSPVHTQNQSSVPHAMRSSFVFGNGVAENDRFESAKERERKAWLADLEKQINEKKFKEMKNTEVKEESTWADKLGTYRPAPFPEQPKDTISGQGDPLATGRASSAPDGEAATFIRGQNVPVDPVTKTELEKQRQRYLEHQTAIREQVQEKERLKRLERERKIKEDLEEEQKLQLERDKLQKQFEMEQQKLRMKEQHRQDQVNQLKAAMDEAQAKALQEKYQRKMQHLEAGGHDTTKLREHLEELTGGLTKQSKTADGELTSRIEQLHTRRERDVQKAKHQLDLQYWGLPPTLEEDENQSQSQLQTAKITPRTEYGAASVIGHPTTVEPTHIPGLDLSTVRTQHQYNHPPVESRRVNHDPYTEDRVLTPSRFRHPSKPHSEPGSPRREFGTQTGKDNDTASSLDGDEITELLNRSLRRDDSDVHIEYRMEKGKRVRVKSAPKEQLKKPQRRAPVVQDQGPPSYREQPSPHEHHHHVRNQKDREEQTRKKKLETQRRRGPVKPGSRPGWGYKNPDKKAPKTQSERDPFFEQKRKQSEERRVKREQKLLAMVKANENVIPDYYVPPPNKSRSRSRDRSPFSDYGGGTPREVQQGRRSKSHSPNRTANDVQTDYLKINHHDHDHSSTSRHDNSRRDRSDSPNQNKNFSNRGRARSPPVPAIRHRTDANHSNNTERRPAGRYGDVDPLDIPVHNGEFVPFTRTIDVLDPAKADEPMPMSREATRIANARKMYHESQKPDMFGTKHNIYADPERRQQVTDVKNPLFNPSLVMDHPTSRQDQILVQLSTLKQSLIQRQRELETFSPSDLEKQDTNLNL